MRTHEMLFLAYCVLVPMRTPREIAKDLVDIFNFNKKQLYRYLKKWNRKGFYSYETEIDLGKFDTDKLPAYCSLDILSQYIVIE